MSREELYNQIRAVVKDLDTRVITVPEAESRLIRLVNDLEKKLRQKEPKKTEPDGKNTIHKA